MKMPKLNLKGLLDKINEGNLDNEELQRLEIPGELGDTVDMIIGQQYKGIHPESVIKLDSGLEVRRSKFMPWKDGEIATIAGPINAFEDLLINYGLHNTIMEMSSIIEIAGSYKAQTVSGSARQEQGRRGCW